MPAPHADSTAVVLGAGIAGLWTAHALHQLGWRVVLLSAGGVGAGQTVASQGIIHGGIKYSLGEATDASARAIARMPELWRDCLAGRGSVDLRDARVLCDHQYLWTTRGWLSKLATAAASQAIRTTVTPVPTDRRPPALRGAHGSIGVFRVDEPVLEIGSVVRALAAGLHEPPIEIDPASVRFDFDGDRVVGVRAQAPGTTRAWACARTVLCAGSGNAELLSRAGDARPDGAKPQTRPLHMVLVRREGEPLPEVFGHCVGASTTPKLTVTTGRTSGTAGSGEPVWYLGGHVAEEGVARDGPAQIDAARATMRDCLPWIDQAGMRFACLRVDRAEGVVGERGRRPEGPTLARNESVAAVWPTKLALAPETARLVAEWAGSPAEASAAPYRAAEHQTAFAPMPWDGDLPWS